MIDEPCDIEYPGPFPPVLKMLFTEEELVQELRERVGQSTAMLLGGHFTSAERLASLSRTCHENRVGVLEQIMEVDRRVTVQAVFAVTC